jgi:hypothetical protein
VRTRRSSATEAVQHAVAALADGGMVVVVDDTDREDEGGLLVAAELVTDRPRRCVPHPSVAGSRRSPARR